MEKANEHYLEAKTTYDFADYKNALRYYLLAKGNYKQLQQKYNADEGSEKFEKRLAKIKGKIKEIRAKIKRTAPPPNSPNSFSSRMPFFAPPQSQSQQGNSTKTTSEKSSFQPTS